MASMFDGRGARFVPACRPAVERVNRATGHELAGLPRVPRFVAADFGREHPVEDAFDIPREVASVDPGCATAVPPLRPTGVSP